MQLDETWRGRCVSNGTLLVADLIPQFISTLAKADRNLASERWLEYVGMEALGSDQGTELLYELFGDLFAIAPEGCYFGAHPGNGTLFGFWDVDVLLDQILREQHTEPLGPDTLVEQAQDAEELSQQLEAVLAEVGW